MDSTPSYLEFFDSVTDTAISAPPTNLGPPTSISPTTHAEGPDKLHQRINKRRGAYMKKAEILRKCIETEKAKLQALGEKYDYKAHNNALNRRIWRISNYISMVVRNFNLAMAEHWQHVASEDLSHVGIAIARSKVLEIESRLRAVEIALQGGIERVMPERRPGVVLGDAGTVYSETGDSSSMVAAADVSEKIEFIQEEWFVQLLAAGHQRKNLPPVGSFRM